MLAKITFVATDYGHADYSNDIEALQTLARGGKITSSLAHKILHDNLKRLNCKCVARKLVRTQLIFAARGHERPQ
jgi:hypothetical protein